MSSSSRLSTKARSSERTISDNSLFEREYSEGAELIVAHSAFITRPNPISPLTAIPPPQSSRRASGARGLYWDFYGSSTGSVRTWVGALRAAPLTHIPDGRFEVYLTDSLQFLCNNRLSRTANLLHKSWGRRRYSLPIRTSASIR